MRHTWVPRTRRIREYRLQSLIVGDRSEIQRVDPPTGADANALAALLAEAFQDDPMQRWLFPNPLRRRRRLERFYRLDIRHRLAGRADVFRAGDHGVAFWHPPSDNSFLPMRSVVRIAPAFVSVAAHHPLRAGRVLGAVVRRRPRAPHWYLSHLAVRGRHRGTGIGRRLLDVGLDLAARDGGGCTSRPPTRTTWPSTRVPASAKSTSFVSPVRRRYGCCGVRRRTERRVRTWGPVLQWRLASNDRAAQCAGRRADSGKERRLPAYGQAVGLRRRDQKLVLDVQLSLSRLSVRAVRWDHLRHARLSVLDEDECSFGITSVHYEGEGDDELVGGVHMHIIPCLALRRLAVLALARWQGQREWMIGASRPSMVAVDEPTIARHIGAALHTVVAMEQRISIVTLGVQDLSRSRRFYEELGWRGQEVEETVFFQAGGLAVVLWSREKLAADAGVADGGSTFGGIALAHNVRSRAEVDGVMHRAASAGAKVTKVPADTSYGGYAGWFCDPDGHVWEIAFNSGFALDERGDLHLPSFD